MRLYLYLRDERVSEMVNVFASEETWYGTLTEGPSGEVAEFVSFFFEWHQRLAANQSPDPDEFDRFSAPIPGVW